MTFLFMEEVMTDYFGTKEKLVRAIVRMATDRPDLGFKEIGEEFGISRWLVSYYTRKAGLRRKRGQGSEAYPKAVRHE